MFNPLQVSKSNTQFKLLSFLIASIVLLLLVELAPSPATPIARADTSASPAVFPIDSSPYGISYGEWSARWWQWALSIPGKKNPVLDSTGQYCDLSQPTQVWYLAGTFGGPVTRSCTIPSDRSILFPVANAIFGAAVGDCTGPADCDIDLLRHNASKSVTRASQLSASLDGVLLPNPTTFRETSPVFDVVLPANAIFGLPRGNFGPNVSDGYWIMLQPLGVGAHTLHFHADFPDNSIDVTYNLTVL